MKGKNGFTLVELLAVIVILGLLMVIIAPKITNTLNESEKKTNMASAQNLVKAAEYKIANNEVKGIKENTIIDYSNNTNTNYLDYSGAKPEIGKVQIRFNGTIAMSVKFGDYCYTKAFDSDEITTTAYNNQTCGNNADVFMNYEIPQITQSGDGLYESTTEYGRLIYRGSNPDNYITLKENNVDTTYRIVSYETDGTIKVVRDESIGDIAWDERTNATTGPRHNSNNTYCNYSGTYYGCNVWGNMNNTYYNSQAFATTFYYKYYENNITTDFQNSSNVGTVTQDSSLNTYLNDIWINKLDFKDNITIHSFYVGGISYYGTYIGGDKGIEKEKKEEQAYTWNGYIGLLNITEFKESSTSMTCTSIWINYHNNPANSNSSTSTFIYENGEWPCSINNWNYRSGYSQESLSADTNGTAGIWYMYIDGSFSTGGTFYNNGVRPTFYLKSATKLGGSGTSTNPYYIIES